MDFKKISEVYRSTNSVKQTAAILQISEVKVRRSLITLDLWSSKTSDEIGSLHKQGLSVKEIAEQLYITEKNVQAYLPYSRGLYGGEVRSSDAIRAEEYRLRRKTCLANQVLNTLPTNGIATKKTFTKERWNESMKTPVNVLKLHLSLDLQDLTPKEWDILKTYGKVETGITRDILVPDTMTLHALHFAIMKLFGWQNSHLHHFELPDDLFQKYTGGMFEQWCNLCGIYFRFPTDDFEDLYWDDDYNGEYSFNSWLKSKYCGPYRYNGYSENYGHCQAEAWTFTTHHKQLEITPPWHLREQTGNFTKKVISPKDATIDDVFRSLAFEAGPNELLERLPLKEVLCTKDKIPSAMSTCEPFNPSPVTDHLIYAYDYGDGWIVHISLVEDVDATDEQINRVKKQKPICVARDGINVLDDVGGPSGFMDFLKNINGEDPIERYELKEWSKFLGWTGRWVKPENLL